MVTPSAAGVPAELTANVARLRRIEAPAAGEARVGGRLCRIGG